MHVSVWQHHQHNALCMASRMHYFLLHFVEKPERVTSAACWTGRAGSQAPQAARRRHLAEGKEYVWATLWYVGCQCPCTVGCAVAPHRVRLLIWQGNPFDATRARTSTKSTPLQCTWCGGDVGDAYAWPGKGCGVQTGFSTSFTRICSKFS